MQLTRFAYMTRGYHHALELIQKVSPEFHDLALAGAKRQLVTQVNYNDIMRAYQGDPSGVEYANRDGHYAFVLADASEPGRYRVQNFDDKGFSGHQTYNSLEEAVEQMVVDGYYREDRGALDRLSATAQWRRGMQVSALIQQFGAGQINYTELDAALAKLPA